MNVTPSFFRLLRDAGSARPLVRRERKRRASRATRRRSSSPTRCGRTQFGGDPRVVGPRSAARRPAVHRRRRDASRILVPEPEDHAVASAGVHGGSEIRRSERHNNNWEAHRPAEARYDAGTGAGADRRAERREPDAVPAIQGSPDRCGLPHQRRRACRTTWCATSSRRCI